MSAGKIVFGSIAVLGLALALSSFTSSNTKKKLKGTGVKDPDFVPPILPDGKPDTTLPDIPPAERSEYDSRPSSDPLLSLKTGGDAYSRYNRVFLHTKPTGGIRWVVNPLKPFKKFDRVGVYNGASAENGWSKVYVEGELNPYLFVRTNSITGVKTL